MQRFSVVVKLVDTYIDFAESDTKNTIKSKVYEIGRAHIGDWKNQHLRNQVLFKTTDATFYDTWYEFGLFTSGKQESFMSFEDRLDFVTDTQLPFGAIMELQLSPKKAVV